jgi:CHAP domain-containing protein
VKATIVTDPPAMVAAASRLKLVAEDLATVAAALRGAELPVMPPAMAARYTGPIHALAIRVATLPEPLLDAADKLVHRAEIAQTATDLDGDATQAAHRVAAALDGVHIGAGPDAPHVDLAPDGGAPPPDGDATVAGAPAEGVHAAVATGGDDAYAPQSPAAPGADDDGALRAAHHDPLGHAPPPPVPDHEAPQHDWACWMASHAAHEDLPPSLPIAMALAGSGLRNLDEHGAGCGFFAVRPGEAVAPPGHGVGPASQPDAEWWRDHPEAQLDHVLRNLSAAAPADTNDTDLARWAADAQPAVPTDDVADSLSLARTLVARCRHGLDDGGGDDAAGGAGAGAHQFVKAVQSQIGVAETAGANAGPEVDRYLSSAQVGSGNPWCASFMTWAMRESGHDMPGTGWAAVSTWVHAAQSGQAGLHVVPPEQAQPGDIVAYDWGGGDDFGQDGHIGMLESPVQNGTFTTVEGNAEDAVTRMHRSLGEGNVVFLRRDA